MMIGTIEVLLVVQSVLLTLQLFTTMAVLAGIVYLAIMEKNRMTEIPQVMFMPGMAGLKGKLSEKPEKPGNGNSGGNYV